MLKTPPIVNPRRGCISVSCNLSLCQAGNVTKLIDDEETILQMVREALTRRGYEVDTASDGTSGLNRLNQSNYDLMLFDWKMPGLSGQEVYEQLRAKDSALAERVIFITGDVVNERVREFLEANKKLCLPKPFSQAEFREAISKVLNTQ